MGAGIIGQSVEGDREGVEGLGLRLLLLLDLPNHVGHTAIRVGGAAAASPSLSRPRRVGGGINGANHPNYRVLEAASRGGEERGEKKSTTGLRGARQESRAGTHRLPAR